MTKLMIFAAASLLAIGVAPSSRAEEKLTLLGGCPEIMEHANCPGARHEGPVPTDFPPDAHPGQCYAQVRRQPVFETYSERYEAAPPRREQRVIPAQYDWAERPVLVEPEHVERHVIPAIYRDVAETVVVRPETYRTQTIEPVYETVTERVLVRPAYTEWRRTFVGPDGFLPEGARVEPTGQVVCLVEIPAEFSTVQRQVLREPGRTVRIPVPAETRIVTRHVVDQAERVEERRIAAVYRTERYRRLIAAERTETIDIPAVYATREKQRETAPGGLEWRLVVCDPKTTAPPYPR